MIQNLHIVGAQRAADAAGSAGGDLTSLGTGRSVSSNGTGLTHVLLVTTSVGVIDGVHRHTSNLGPLIALDSVLVESATSLEDGLVGTATAGDQTNHGTAHVVDGLLGTGRKADSGDALIGVLRHNNSIVTGSTAHLTAVTDLLLNVADDGTFGDLTDGQDVSNSKSSYSR